MTTIKQPPERGYTPPTEKMCNYLLLLFNDTGFTEESRLAWLTNRVKRPIHNMGELKFFEAGEAIDRLKQIRESQR